MLTISDRPTRFDDMVGHKVLLKEMKNYTKDGKMNFPEVMLFEGESGTGKTTLAYIISALLNDPNPIKTSEGFYDPNPESLTFSDVFDQKFGRDVRFYNAAKMGKDEILALEQVLTVMPMFDKKKIIIIDEAQEISKAGKGAALALLEKKRKNVHLILCTMDIDAFDKSVRSRCQQYKFKRVSSKEIAEYLLTLIPESTPVPDEFVTESLFTIADSCDGSVRLAVQMLERALSAGLFIAQDIIKEFGLVSEKAMGDILVKFSKKDSSALQDIGKSDLKELFYKMYKTMTTAKIFQLSGYLDESWKEGLAKTLLKSEHFEGLYETFCKIDCDCSQYFRPNNFFFHLTKFLSEPEKPSSRALAESTEPTRTPARRIPVGE